MSSPDTWTEPDWRDFQWFGVCDCGLLRHEHVVRDAGGLVTDDRAAFVPHRIPLTEGT